jgi:hypothetical protein
MLSLRPLASPQSDLDGEWTYMKCPFARYLDLRIVSA